MNNRNILFFNSIPPNIFSCKPTANNRNEHEVKTANNFNRDSVKNQFIKANQQVIIKENDEMDAYAKQHQLPFIKTNSGIRYHVYQASEKGDSIKPGMQITMAYKVKLLSGETVYSSKELGKKTFLVEQENIESGIHKGVQFLKRGDKAILLIASHLAHGLLGDMNKIPPQMPIIYEVQID